MVKLLVLFVCALGAVGAGRIPPSDNDINYKLVLGNRRPLFFDPFNPLRVFQNRNQETLNSRQRIDRDEQQEQLQLQDEDDDRVGYEQEVRYNRVPLGGNVDDLPTVSQDSSRLLYVGRRRQQQSQERREDQDERQQSSARRQGFYGDIDREQEERGDFFGGARRGFFERRQQEENVGPRRFSRIGEGRRVGDVDSVTEQDILRFIRLDNRLGEFSDEQIVEILRRQREQQAEARRVEARQGVEQEREQVRDELPTARRDDDRLVYINRRRLDQSRADLIPRRIVRIGEGRRVDEEQLGYNRFDQRYNEQFIQSQRERVQQRERVREQEEQRERVRQEQEQRERVRQQEEQVREQQQQRERVREQQQQRERVREEQQQRERVREQQQQEENVRVLQQRENERERIRVQQQRENEREQQQERVRVQQQRENERERVQERGDDDDVQRLSDTLPSVRRDDKRLVYINRRRQGDNVVVARRVDRIGEGRRVGDVDPVSEQDILQFIRRDNRLSYLSDDEVVEMLRRNRERQQQAGERRVGQQEGEEEQEDREQGLQGEGLQTVRRDDDRLVYVNRRRLGKVVN